MPFRFRLFTALLASAACAWGQAKSPAVEGLDQCLEQAGDRVKSLATLIGALREERDRQTQKATENGRALQESSAAKQKVEQALEGALEAMRVSDGAKAGAEVKAQEFQRAVQKAMDEKRKVEVDLAAATEHQAALRNSLAEEKAKLVESARKLDGQSAIVASKEQALLAEKLATKTQRAELVKVTEQLAMIQAEQSRDKAALAATARKAEDWEKAAKAIDPAALTLAQERAQIAEAKLAKLAAEPKITPEEKAAAEKLREENQALAKQAQEAAAAHAAMTAEGDRLRQELAKLSAAQQQLTNQFLRIDPIAYALNSSDVSAEQVRVLHQVNKILSAYPDAKFEISGHTCTLGSEERNRTLSEQRAQRLQAFLAERGVPAAQLSALGHGPAKPVADNSTEESRRKNRRVEIKVLSATGAVLLDTAGQAEAEVPGR